jgi:hypothetical protein
VRRILAAVVAVLFLVGGFAAYKFRTNEDRGQVAIRLWCTNEVKETCESVERQWPERYLVMVRTPREIEKAAKDFTKNPVQVVLTSTLWADRIRTYVPALKTVVGQSDLVVVTKSGASACPALKCVDTAQVAIGVPEEDLSGLSTLSAVGTHLGLSGATLDSGTDEEESAVSKIRNEIKPGLLANAIATLNATGILDAVIAPRWAVTGVASTLRIEPISPNTVMKLELLASANDSRLDSLPDFLTDELVRNGWDRPSGTTATGDAALASWLLERTK